MPVVHAGWGSVRFGEGPNAVLRSYFRRKAGIIDAPRPSGGWPTLHEKEIANEWYKRGASVQFDEHENVMGVWTASDPLIQSLFSIHTPVPLSFGKITFPRSMVTPVAMSSAMIKMPSRSA